MDKEFKEKMIENYSSIWGEIGRTQIEHERNLAELSLKIDGLSKVLGFIWREGGHWEKEDE
jgi:hypothetical protein